MMRAARVHWASFAIALVLFGLGWGTNDAAAALPPIEGAAQTGAMYLHLGEAGLLTSSGKGEGLCSRALPPGGEEQVDRGREEIQLAGPVRRTARRTARRTSRRR